MASFKELNKRRYKLPWSPVDAVLGTIIIFIAAQVIGVIGITIYGLILGWDSATLYTWLSDTVRGRFFYVLLIELSMLALLYLFLRSRRAHPYDIGLKKPRLRDIGYVIAGFFTYFGLYIVVLQFVQLFAPGIDITQEQEIGFDTNITGNALVYVFISLVVLPPIVEEILVRGFLYSGLRTRMNIINAGLITSVLFGLAHLQFGSDAPLLWIAAIDTFVLSVVLIYLREKTGSLWSPIGLHAVKNGIAFIALFVLNVA